MEKGDLIYYYNCYDNSNTRNENMIKCYNNLEANSCMMIGNIYIREKSRTKPEILKIKNGFINSKLTFNKDNKIEEKGEKGEKEEKKEIKCEFSYEELINMIYTRNPFDNLKIPGFKLVNKAPINYLIDTIIRLKMEKEKIGNKF